MSKRGVTMKGFEYPDAHLCCRSRHSMAANAACHLRVRGRRYVELTAEQKREDPFGKGEPAGIHRFRLICRARFRHTFAPRGVAVTILHLEKQNSPHLDFTCCRSKRLSERKPNLPERDTREPYQSVSRG